MGSGRTGATGRVRTRASGVSFLGLVAPFVSLAIGIATIVLAQREVSTMYDRGAGIVDARQFQPYVWRVRYELGADQRAAGRERVAALAAAQRDVARAVDPGAVIGAWAERGGSIAAVTTLVTPDADRIVDRFAAAPAGARQVAWSEGGRLVVVFTAVGLDDATFARRAGELRSVVHFARVASFLAGGLAIFVALVALFVALALGPGLAVLALVAGTRWLRGVWRAFRPGPDEPPYADVGLSPGIRVTTGRTIRGQGTSVFALAPLILLTPLALVDALRPASLGWFAVVAVRWMVGRTRDTRGTLWLRRLFLVLFAAGLAHGLAAWPPRSPLDDRRVQLVMAAAALVALALWWRWRRTRHAVAVRVTSVRGVMAGAHRAGVALTAAGAASVFTLATGIVPWHDQLAPRGRGLVGLAVVPVLALWARGAVGLAADERQLRLGRAPVLFLRSFDDDSRRVLSRPWHRVGPERFLPWPLERFEDVLVRSLRAVGPVVSIGKPGTRQRQLSATRRLVVGDDWVTAVTEEMARARLVVVVLGRTAGLHTELRELALRSLLGKCCFVVPAVDRAEAAARLAAATEVLGGRGEWGDVHSDDLGHDRRLVALVGLGHGRSVFAHRSRRDSRAYVALGRYLADLYVAPTAGDDVDAAPAPAPGPS